MAIPKDFFTPESFATLTGAAGITVVVTNGLRQAFFKITPAWLALAVAELISVLGTYISHHPDGGTPDATWITYAVGVLNGFLIFATAAGMNQVAGKQESNAKAAAERAGTVPKRDIFDSW